MKEYILAVLNFLHTDGLLNKLLFMKEDYASPMVGVVDFVWGLMSPWFQGGQTPIYRRIPKRGFNNKRFETKYATINLADLE